MQKETYLKNNHWVVSRFMRPFADLKRRPDWQIRSPMVPFKLDRNEQECNRLDRSFTPVGYISGEPKRRNLKAYVRFRGHFTEKGDRDPSRC